MGLQKAEAQLENAREAALAAQQDSDDVREQRKHLLQSAHEMAGPLQERSPLQLTSRSEMMVGSISHSVIHARTMHSSTKHSDAMPPPLQGSRGKPPIPSDTTPAAAEPHGSSAGGGDSRGPMASGDGAPASGFREVLRGGSLSDESDASMAGCGVTGDAHAEPSDDDDDGVSCVLFSACRALLSMYSGACRQVKKGCT